MSDQDFRFEDESKSDAKKAPKKATKSTASNAVQAQEFNSNGLEVTITIAALIAVVALLVGLIGGIFIGKSLTPPETVIETPSGSGMGNMGTGGMGGTSGSGTSGSGTTGSGTTGTSGTGTTPEAPVLTDDQVQQGESGMPAGHPAVGGETTTDDTKTDDKK